MPVKTKGTSEESLPAEQRTSFLDYTFFGKFSVEFVIFAIILLFAIATRLWDLGFKALHHDESLHAIYSKYLYDGMRSFGEAMLKGFRGEIPFTQAIGAYFGSDRGQGLNYYFDPMMHGPLLFHLTGISYLIAGFLQYFFQLPLIFIIAYTLFLIGSSMLPSLLRKRGLAIHRFWETFLIIIINLILFFSLILAKTGFSTDNLAGVNDYTSRLIPGLLGIVLVLSPWFFRPVLGRLGAILCSLGLLISPTVLYVSRFQRHDIYLILATFGIVLGILRYIRTEDKTWFYVFMLSLSAGWTLLEVNYINIFIFVMFLVFYLGVEFLSRRTITKAPAPKTSLMTSLKNQIRDPQTSSFLVSHVLVSFIFFFAILNFSLPNTEAPSFLSSAFTGKFPLLGIASLQVSFAPGALLISMIAGVLVTIALTLLIGTFVWIKQEKQAFQSSPLLVKLTGILGNPEIFYTGILLFFIPILILYTTLFSNPVGFLQAIPIPWETRTSLGYWLAQQHVQRGDQPWSYYPSLMLPYEILFVLFALITVGKTAFNLGIRKLKEGWVFLSVFTFSFLIFEGENLKRYLAYSAQKAANVLEKESLLSVRAETLYGLFVIFSMFVLIFGTSYLVGYLKAKKLKQLPAVPTTTLPYFEEIFVISWTAMILLIMSWAGEKMPWLNMHIAAPTVILATYSLRDMIKQLLPVIKKFYLSIFLIGISGFYIAFLGTNPQYLTTTLYLVLPVILIGVAAGNIITKADLVSSAIKVVVLGATLGLLGGYTITSAARLSYVLPDDPAELLVYTQSSKDVIDVANSIKKVAASFANPASDMNITIESTQTWPFVWYLQNFPNIGYPATVTTLNNEEVVLISKDTKNDTAQSALMQQLQQNYVGEEYTLRWWWIPDMTPWTKTIDVPATTAGGQAQKEPVFNSFGFWTSPELWHWYLTKEVWENKVYPQTKGTYDGYFYVRKDLAKYVWKDGVPIGQNPQAGNETTNTTQKATATYGEAVPAVGMLNFGSLGQDPGKFAEPKGVLVNSRGIYVLDRGNNRIQLFDSKGTFNRAFGKQGEIKNGPADGLFSSPGAIDADSKGEVYVTDMWNHRIQVFSSDGAFVRTFGTPGQNPQAGEFWGPRGISIYDNEVFVADTGNKIVKVFSLDGLFLRSFGGAGMENGKFNEPIGILATKDAVYVADTWNHRIQKFSPAGTYLAQWSIEGWNDQHNHNEPQLAVGKDGSILATDPPNNRILKFSTDGKFLGMRGTAGVADGQFGKPTGISVDKNGDIYLTDTLNNRVQKIKGF